MKNRAVLLLAIISLFTACRNQETTSNSLNEKGEISKSRTVISGKIASPSNNVINLSFTDIFCERNTFTQTKNIDDNSFNFEFEIANETEVFLNIGDKTISLLISPKDSINILFKPSYFNNNSKISENKIHISGSNKILNKANQENFDYIISQKPYFYKIDPSKNSVSSLFYKIEKRYKYEISNLEDYSKNNKSSKKFIEWKKTSIKFRIAVNLLYYHMYLTSNNIEKNDSLFNSDFFNNYDEKALNTYAYVTYIWNFTPQKYCYYDQKFSSFYDKKEYENAFNYSIGQVLSQESNPIIRDVVMMRLLIMFHSISAVDFNKIWKRKDEIFNNEIFIREFDRRFINPKNEDYNSSLKSLKSEGDKSTILNKIITSSNDKVVFLDIWATWRGPCLSEIPYLLELDSQLKKDSTIEIIGVCLNSDKQKWQKLLKDNNIPGSQYFLNKEESKLFREQLSFRSFPTYMIIKNGVIINNNAERPSSKNKILEELEILTKTK